MATTEQIQDLNHFLETLPQAERESLSIDEIYSLWHHQAFRDEDVLAIEEAVQDFQDGQRGRPFQQFIAEFKSARQKIE